MNPEALSGDGRPKRMLVIIGLMVILLGGMVAYFRRRGWL